MSAGRTSGSRLVWAGYLGCGWGLAFAAISFYWGSGGTLGTETVWGSLTMSPSQRTILLAAVWVTGFLKVFAALLAHALVARWGSRLPRRPIAVLGWCAAVVLTLSSARLTLVRCGPDKHRLPDPRLRLASSLYVWVASICAEFRRCTARAQILNTRRL